MTDLVHRIWRLLVLGLLGAGVRDVTGIEIYTPKEVEAVNGTNVKLKCTFSSSHPVSASSVTVSWNFRPIGSGKDETVFYYQDEAYPPMEGRFKGHAVWSGDVLKRDVSITLHEVPPTFNGTYICQVRNLPDVHGSNGEIILRVVNKASFSEIALLAAVAGGACALILVLLAIFVAVRYYREKRRSPDIEMPLREGEPKESSVW